QGLRDRLGDEVRIVADDEDGGHGRGHAAMLPPSFPVVVFGVFDDPGGIRSSSPSASLRGFYSPPWTPPGATRSGVRFRSNLERTIFLDTPGSSSDYLGRTSHLIPWLCEQPDPNHDRGMA